MTGNHHRVAAKVVSKIERGRPATLVHGFGLAVFRARARARARSYDCIIPSRSTRCSGGNLIMDRIVEIRSIMASRGTAVCGP